MTAKAIGKAAFAFLATMASAACLVTIAPLAEDASDASDSSSDGAMASDAGCDGLCPPVKISGQLGSAPWGIYVAGETVFYVTRDVGEVIDLAQPQPITTGLAGPVSITGIGTSTLYWTMSGSGSGDAAAAGLGSLQNGGTRLSVAAQLGDAGAIAPFELRQLDGGDLAWTSSTAVAGRVFRTTSDLQHTHVISAQELVYNYITTDGDHIWVVADGTEHSVYRIDTDDAGRTTEHLVLSFDGGSGPLDYRSGKIYVTSYSGGYVGVVDDPLAMTAQTLRVLVPPGTALPGADGGPAVY